MRLNWRLGKGMPRLVCVYYYRVSKPGQTRRYTAARDAAERRRLKSKKAAQKHPHRR
jgi:hypothetical protein